MTTDITFIGVGRMGGPMAQRLLEAGYSIAALDKDPAALAAITNKGGTVIQSLEEIDSRVIITSLPTPVILEKVAADLPKNKTDQNSILIDMSTTGAQAAQRIAETLSQKGISMIDAPVSGGIKGAIKGTLAISASGPEGPYNKVLPILNILGKVFYVGPLPGQGQTVKLINNLLSVAAVAISAEAIVMAEKAGLDVAQTLEIINSGSGRNSATADKFPNHVLTRTFDYGFALDLADKDVRLCLQEADAIGVPMIVGGAVRQLMAICRQSCGNTADITDVVSTVEKWAGVRVADK